MSKFKLNDIVMCVSVGDVGFNTFARELTLYKLYNVISHNNELIYLRRSDSLRVSGGFLPSRFILVDSLTLLEKELV